MVTKFTPETSLEKEISCILDQEKPKNADDINIEDHNNCFSLENIKARQLELQKMRSFMFFQDQKLKRAARIKSKSYHRLRKKDKLKAMAKDESSILKLKMQAEYERLKVGVYNIFSLFRIV